MKEQLIKACRMHAEGELERAMPDGIFFDVKRDIINVYPANSEADTTNFMDYVIRFR